MLANECDCCLVRTDQGKEPSGTSNENRTRIINGAVHDPIGDRSKDLFDNSNFHQANKKVWKLRKGTNPFEIRPSPFLPYCAGA